MKTCTGCQTAQPITEYHLDKSTADGLRRRCKTCVRAAYTARRPEQLAVSAEWRRANPDRAAAHSRSWRGRNPEYHQEHYRENRDRYAARNRRATLAQYGLTETEYDAMSAAQDGRCAICRDLPGPKGLCVDHCHSTGAVRGLLCTRCNLGLGYFRDNPAAILAAADYLEAARCESA